MADISKEAVERLAKTADLFAKAMKAFQHHTKKHNEDVRDTLRAQAARIAELEAALEPFSEMAGELFARNYNNDILVMRVGEFGQSKEITAGQFFNARKALAKDTSHDG